MSHCPWCNEDIVSWKAALKTGRGTPTTTFAAHVQKCPDAPDSVKAAYRS